MLMSIAEVCRRLFFHGAQDCFSLPFGEQFLWFPLAFVREDGDTLLQIPLFQMDSMGAREAGQRLHFFATAVSIGEEYCLGAKSLVLSICGLYESAQFRNLYVVKPLYVFSISHYCAISLCGVYRE